MTFAELKELLDEAHERYNTPAFIQDDPISIPHQFKAKEDIEIAGFFAAMLAWGQRKQIIRSANLLMQMMDEQPFKFVMNASAQEIVLFNKFVYRTFNGKDCMLFIKALRRIYEHHQGLETVFTDAYRLQSDIKASIINFRKVFLDVSHLKRSEKHISDAAKGSACKRINLFLRWMVRNDSRGVDFGIWRDIPSKALYLPLDLHTGNTSRALGLLNIKQNNWKAVAELTDNLRKFDAEDPVKYDFALFGIGMYDKIRL